MPSEGLPQFPGIRKLLDITYRDGKLLCNAIGDQQPEEREFGFRCPSASGVAAWRIVPCTMDSAGAPSASEETRMPLIRLRQLVPTATARRASQTATSKKQGTYLITTSDIHLLCHVCASDLIKIIFFSS